MNAKRSLAIGFSQVFAIVPGVSRSGITLSTGRLLGMDRESIAKFTFLMSTPIILGDGLYHMKNLLHTHIDAVPFITALVVSAVVGMLCISFLLGYLKKKGFGVFAIYRFALGALVIALYFIK
jgi:undecaprenyl-diphosphatase